MLKQRVITAVILASVIISSVIFLPTDFLALVLAIVIALGAWEWSACAGFIVRSHRIAYVCIIMICLMVCLSQLYQPWMIYIVGCGLLWWAIAIFLVMYYQKHKHINLTSRFLKAVIGVLIIVPAWLSLLLIHAQESGVVLLLFLFLLIWLADIAAYFSGRRFGNKKLASHVSPGKSWEGVYGSVIMSLLFAGLYAAYAEMQAMYAVLFLALVVFTVCFSILGDLVESMFKRMAGVKDSSNILPGHGGVLDRIDSLTSAAPVFFAGLWVMERIL